MEEKIVIKKKQTDDEKWKDNFEEKKIKKEKNTRNLKITMF